MNKTTKKILFTIYQSGNRSNGGVESITQIISHLSNWECIIWTNRQTPKNQIWKTANVNIQISNASIPGSIPSKLQALIAQNISIYQFIKQHQIKLVHCNDIMTMATCGIGVKLTGAKLVFNIRDTKPSYEWYNIKWKLAKHFANYILVLSAEMQKQIVEKLHIKAKDKTGYQYSIVNFDKFDSYDAEKKLVLKKKLNISPDTYNIGIVAAFMPKKQQLDFIRNAVPLIVKAIPNAIVYFIGDFDTSENEYAKDCLEAAQDNGTIQKIKFAGYQSNVNDWYNMIDITVVASKREGLARCMIESISCGTPVVSFDVCSAKEILENHQCGYVVKQGDYQAMNEAIYSLYENEKTYQIFSDNGIKTSRSLFHKDKIISAYEELYNHLLQ